MHKADINMAGDVLVHVHVIYLLRAFPFCCFTPRITHVKKGRRHTHTYVLRAFPFCCFKLRITHVEKTVLTCSTDTAMSKEKNRDFQVSRKRGDQILKIPDS